MLNYIDSNDYYYKYNFKTIPTDLFENIAKSASYEVKLRIHNKDITGHEEEVKYTTCLVADIIYEKYLMQKEMKDIITTKNKIITSEKIGDWSRNYNNVGIADLISLSSDEETSAKITNVCETNLYFTGLLYGGLRVV